MIHRLVRRAAAISLVVACITGLPASASAQQDETPTPTPGETTLETATDKESNDDNLGQASGASGGLTDLATLSADNALRDDADNESAAVERPEIGILPVQDAARARADLADTERPCAEWGDGSFVAPVSAEELAAEGNAAADREAELLSHIVAARDGADRVLTAANAKPAKTPLHYQRPTRLMMQEVDVDAVLQIFQDIQDALDAAADDFSSILTGSGEDECIVEYYCGAERVDDFISGRIDSEPSGAYADYVTEVAGALDVATASIRDIETNPVLSAGETTPSISAPSSETGIQSLASVVADRGLGESPEGLFSPIFRYCRIGEDGPIEIDDTVAEFLLPSFSWSPLADEFDIDGASIDIVDTITRTLQGQLPEMRTTPPMDTGATIVQFPMWLWLDDPFLETSATAISNLRTIRVQGHAVLDHVTWTLGDHEIVCTVEDMQAWVPNTNLDPAAPPECHHIFHDLTTYTTTAAATYRIEQDIARVTAPGYPWPPANWQPHPTNPFVTISSTGPEVTVREIRSVNVTQDYGND